MKQARDFIIPFDWDNRKPILLEKCLYIPPCFSNHDPKMIRWDDPAIFEKPQPLVIEFCSGNGLWIAHMAKQMPHLNWIAVEKDFERSRKIWLKINRRRLPNLFLVFGEALTFASHYVPAESISEIYVNFPDPWPKRRHAKHRLIQQPFVKQIARALTPRGIATIVTDDVDTSERIIAQFAAWKSLFGEKSFATDWPEFYASYFHSLWLQKQRTIRYHRYIQSEAMPTLGVCLPTEVLKSEREAFLESLDGVDYRMVSETFLSEEWDGLDTIVVMQPISASGRRKLMGFCAAGGVVATFGERLGLSNEISGSEWLALNKVRGRGI